MNSASRAVVSCIALLGGDDSEHGAPDDLALWFYEDVVRTSAEADLFLPVLVLREAVDIRPAYRAGNMEPQRWAGRGDRTNPVIDVLGMALGTSVLQDSDRPLADQIRDHL